MFSELFANILITMTVGTGKFISRKVSKVRWLPQTDTSQLESSILVNTQFLLVTALLI